MGIILLISMVVIVSGGLFWLMVYLDEKPVKLKCDICGEESTDQSDHRWRQRIWTGKWEHDCDGKETINKEACNGS